MVDTNLIAQLDIDDKEAELMLAEELGQEVAGGNMDTLVASQMGCLLYTSPSPRDRG